ncbi:PIN domain nuclease [soil metagenome]
MYLVDTSVWIDYLRERETVGAAKFAEALDRGIPFGLTGIVYQEVLQGAATGDDFERLAEYLGTQRFYEPLDVVESYREAARLYFRCRGSGVTVRSTVDCLIARTAIEHDLVLLHGNRDYENMAHVIPELKTA